MAVEIASAYVSIIPSMRGAQGAIARHFTSSSAMAEADSAGRSIGSRLLGGATKALAVSTAAVGALGAAVTGLAIKGGISRQLQIEDAQSKLVSLGHNTQAVQTIMDDALKAVKGTAYGLGDAATMAATAVAAGVKPGEELQKYLTLVGDAATVAGVSMGEMGQIFGKVQTSGRAYTTELNQLADRGIPIYQWLAEEYGVTALELRKMVSAGQVDAETYRKVIEENIGGAALQMGSTTRGAFANMMAALSRVGVQLTQWFFPLIKTVFNAVTGILDGVTDVLKPFSEAFSEAFQAKAGPAIEAWGARAIDWLGRVQAGFLLFSTGEFSSEIREALGVEEDAPLVGTLLRARDLALEVTGGFSAMFGAYKAGGSDVTSAGFAGVLERVGLGARWARDEVVGGVRAMVGAFRDGGSDVTSSGFAGVLESLGLIARSLWDAIGPTLRELGPTILTTAAAFSPFLIALDGIVPVLPVIGESLAAIADSIGGVLLAVLPVVAKAFADVGVVLSGAISAVLPSLVVVLEAMAVSLVALTPAIVAVVPVLAALIVKAVELVTPLLQIKPLVIAAAAALVVWKSGLIGSTAAMARNTAAWVANASAMVVSAAQTTYLAALYAKDLVVSAVRSTAAVARQSAAWVANTAALLVNNRAAIASSVAARASAVATNAAALATRAFNLVLRANPIGLIVTAITGLVGALVWFFTKTDTGRKIVKAAWSGIQSAISSVSDWFTGSVMPVLTASWDAIGAGVLWLYDHAIKPAWAGIQSAISVAWGVIKPIVDANVAIFKFLGDVFWNVSTLVIQASWLALQASFRLGWAFLRDSVIKPLRDAWNAVGAGFSWVWTGVIQPAWAGLQAGLAAGWLWIRVNVFDPVNTGVAAVGSAFDATRVAIGIAWDLILLAAGAAWKWIRDNVFAPINSGVDTVGNGFSLAGETIGLAWEAIRVAGKSAWNWIRENIFAPFGKGIEAIGEAFNSARDVVSAAWDAISDAAVKPVNFVIETVYTGGIKKLFDTVAEKLGLSQRLPALSPIGGAPSNSSSSRPINRGMYYAGGVLPGYTPGADVHHFTSPTAGQLSLSGGEAIMVPEWTRAVGGPGAVAAMNAAARQGAGVRSRTSASFWGGGIWDAVKRGAGAAWDFTTDAASAIGNFMRDPVAGALKVFTAPIEALLKEIGGGSFGEIIEGAPRALVKGIVDGASRIFGPARDDGTDPAKAGNVTPGASPMGIAAMTAALQAMLPGARVTSGLRRGATVAGTGNLSMHGMGRAIDIGSPTMAMFNKILGTYPGATELLFSPAGARQRQRGRGGSFAGDTSGITKRMHYDHIHWGMKDGGVIPTLYDDGGWLKPGISVVENRTNKPEPVLTSNQWQTLDKTQNNGPVLHYHAAENKSLSAEQELRAAVNRAAAISGFGGHG